MKNKKQVTGGNPIHNLRFDPNAPLKWPLMERWI